MAMPKRTRNYLLIAAGIAILISSFVLLALYSAFQVFREQSRQRYEKGRIYAELWDEIHPKAVIGVDREKVYQAMLDEGAWYSVKCREIENDSIFDYFYFGPKDREDVFFFVTTSIYQADGRYLLARIAHNADLLNDLPPEDCLPAELK